ncbi:hypothetical protein CMO93_02745 [Candidatus Woesearchaeota archaeon]|nr:hypothetical protein [Candidatus Woesearchaeota archaeon]|tara:strand:- start:689 stop:1207 length:519 start_codon:yes stop_codon:yes gene_type:complete
MVEKKQIVLDLMLKYNGPLSVEDFYKEVAKWMDEKGMQKEIKRKSEEVTSKGRGIEWVIEAWKNPTHELKQMVRMRTLFKDVKEERVKRKGRNIRINSGNVLINIDGWIESELAERWTIQPFYTLLRTFIDKYFWGIGQTETERHEGPVIDYCYDLHKRLKAFFELYKMKVK